MDIEINCETTEEYEWFKDNLKEHVENAIFECGSTLYITPPDGKGYSTVYKGCNDQMEGNKK